MERPRYFRVAAALILLFGAALRLWQLGTASLWIDEVWTQLSTEGSIHQTIVRTLELGNQTPVYFLTLHLFPRDTDFLLRLPSVLFGIIGVALVMLVALRLYNDCNYALLAGALFAFNPYFIWLSRTARYYSLLFIFSLLASYYFLVLLRNDRNRRVWILFVLSSMGAYMTHYFAAANPIAQYVLFSFLLSRKRRFFRRWMVAQVIAVLPLLVWMVLLSQQEVLSIGIGWIPKPSWKAPLQTLWDMTVGYDGGVRLDGSLRWYVPFGLVSAAVGLAVGIYDALQNHRTNPINFFWFWLLVAPLVLVFALSTALRSLYVDRYFVVVLPAVLLLMLVGWRRLSRVGTALAAIFIIAASRDSRGIQ
ncbi:MAG TPA: glycosyltransferase family 39 protein [Aggregatilineaceae bacterium]|nr:glycosyltransferase family 39 protein [Aggregatilineaceae bacterium]